MRHIPLLLLVLALTGATQPLEAQRQISWQAADANGAVAATSGTRALYTSTGQAAVGPSAIGLHMLESGFLSIRVVPLAIPYLEVAGAIDFGDVLVGQSSDQTLEVKNSGRGILHVSGCTIAGDEFRILQGGGPQSIDPGASGSVRLRFTPSSEGSKAGTLTINSNASNGTVTHVALTGRGAARVPALQLSAQSLDFGTSEVGTPVVRSVTLSNSGTGDLHISDIRLTGSWVSDFAVTRPCAATIPPAGSDHMDVTFLPTSAGGKTAALQFTTNDASHVSVSIALSGIGATAGTPAIALSAMLLDFGVTAPNIAVTRDLVVSNTGTAPLTITQQRVTGEGFTLAAALATLVQPGQQTTARLSFSAATARTATGAFEIGSNDPTTPSVVVSLRAECQTSVENPRIALSATILEFGTVMVPGEKILGVEITNSGSKDLRIISTMTSDPNNEFSIAQYPSSTILPGGRSEVRVSFKPRGSGLRQGNLSIESNDPVTSTATVELRGNAVTVVERIGVAPERTALEQNYPNPFTTSTTIRFSVMNGGNVALRVFDPFGRMIATIIESRQLPGVYSVRFDAGTLPSGTYLLALELPNTVMYRRMTIVR